jgi:sigma-B regulation protein RsbU (phosphoserine phosphatase)
LISPKPLFQADGVIGGVSLDKTLQREIHLARNIQMKLLNGDKPELPSGEATGVSIPARVIGGDYFDFYQLEGGKIRIIIADVMGKGIPAAMLMILTRGVFRSAAAAAHGPGETLTAMNNAMFKDLRKLSSFVTVFCADWDTLTGEFVYANAGHNLPVIIRSNADRMELSNLKGVMLGGLSGQIYTEGQLQLAEGDLVFLYTDGIVEAQNHDGEMYRLERLIRLLTECRDRKAADIEAVVMEQLNEFTTGLPQKDDITMVTLKAGGNPKLIR